MFADLGDDEKLRDKKETANIVQIDVEFYLSLALSFH